MKYIGFIKEHNKIVEAISYSEVVHTKNDNNQILIEKVLNYLNSGSLIFSWMGYFIDFDNKTLIAPDSYYSYGS
ncbi:MAG: hypothetical protein ACKO96_44165, partial [Flammeovirgaceae bacterium]